eukprot:NODE_1832_length_1787_cov_46.685697_g1552_i0.p1 GENE.NODE_1832_length_1787_cov_46.685697_g1552_i0~~NODE_1832_length_1787_cov_46.685697_g1552_i0.p1  ORF type:complete len:540 (+),score=118.52 NODE_1832_length_1787_cov_46.685697_g1552_i0:66-1622(+)
MSPHLAPKPKDWGDEIDVVGFWFLDMPLNYTPPNDLLHFLSAGPPPLYIGFGSIVVEDPSSLSKLVVEAVQKANVRCILHQGWAKLGQGMTLDENIFSLADAVPHDWLFPRCSAVCHHGGAGTTAAGLRFGKPTIIVPFFGDQFFWGERVSALQVGPRPIPRRSLTVQLFADAISYCYQEFVVINAQELAKHIEAEDGLTAGVIAFERKLPIRGFDWIVFTYELQRYHLFKGWSDSLLPSDPPHWTSSPWMQHRVTTRDGFKLPPGWKWSSEWSVEITDDTDNEGWQYSTNFPSKFHPEARNTDAVRKRKWVRGRQYDESLADGVRSMMLDLPPELGGLTYLYVTIKEAMLNDMANATSFRPSLYCSLYLQRGMEKTILQEQRTKYVTPSSNPKWNDTKFFKVKIEDELIVNVWNDGLLMKNLLATLSMDLSQLPLLKEAPYQQDGWWELKAKNVEKYGKLSLSFKVQEGNTANIPTSSSLMTPRSTRRKTIVTSQPNSPFLSHPFAIDSNLSDTELP